MASSLNIVIDVFLFIFHVSARQRSNLFLSYVLLLLLSPRRGRWYWTLGGEDRALATDVWIIADKLKEIQARSYFTAE